MEPRSLSTFGTYGFLSVLVAAQIAASPLLFAVAPDRLDRALVDAKKSARAVKRDIKKNARKATGQENTWETVKDEVSDAGKNIKDEAKYQKRKIQRKTAE